MRLAERVTFGGSGLERAGPQRADAAMTSAWLADPSARLLPLWRGKPLVVAGDRLGWLPPGHEVARIAGEAPVFLGLDEAGPRFAADVSRWQPSEIDAAALASFFDATAQHHPALPADHLFAELRGAMTRLSPREAELAATAKALLGWHGSHRFCSRCGAASAAADAGWRRTCPTCGTHHFPRSDPVVIMLVEYGNRLLLGRAPGWPAGMYSLLAGFVEPGETIEAAVRREVSEETGVKVGRVAYLASQPWPFPSSLMIGCRAEAETEEIRLDPAELEDARWLSREALVDVVGGRHPEVKGARPGAIAHFLIRNWLADRLD